MYDKQRMWSVILFWRLVALSAAICIIGLPMVSFWQAIFLMVFVLGLCHTAPVRVVGAKRQVVLLISVIVLAAVARFIPSPAVDESSNAYVPFNRVTQVRGGLLPVEVENYFAQKFSTYYPVAAQDNASGSVNWQEIVTPTRSASFSTEAWFQHTDASRKVSVIDFNNYRGLRAGFINDNSSVLGHYNFYTSNPQRFLARERMPFFVNYRFPTSLAGAQLCWRGVLFLKKGERYQLQSAAQLRCLRLVKSQLPLSVIGLSLPGKRDLSMRVHFPWVWHMMLACKILLKGVCLILLLCLLRISVKTFFQESILLCVTLMIISLVSHGLTVFADMPVLKGGDDGLIYQGFGREIAYHVMHADFVSALRGGVDIFYFMPGMRYVCAIQGLVFGDTMLGFLLLLVWFVFLMRGLCVLCFSLRHALILLAVFLVLSFATFIRYALHFNAELAGYCFLAAGLLLILRALRRRSLCQFTLASLLFALAILVRPNFLIGVVLCLSYCAVYFLKFRVWWRVVIAACPLAFTGLCLLHNLYFGHQFVFFTSSAFNARNFVLTPATYWAAFSAMIHGSTNIAFFQVVHHLFYNWLNCGLFLLPLILLVAFACQKNLTPLEKAVLLLILGLQLPSLFWAAGGRYNSYVWILTYLVALNMLMDWVKNKFTGLGEKVANF